ncbi:HEAT repeat domain-containing protein [Gimesia panareensis]|nr:HEAT repeat domain-containing protein [Gimesia panareensis]
MESDEKQVRQAIEYLLGIDKTEHWPATDPPIPMSPEDYGVVSAMSLGKMNVPTAESMAALIYGAIHFDDPYVKIACSEAISDINLKLAKSIFYLQTMDTDSDVRERAFELLWNSDTADLGLARSVRDRLLHDPDEFVRSTASRYIDP